MTVPAAYLSDPSGGNPLAGAARWVEALVIGSFATAAATLAVAAVGFLMLQGRLPVRRGLVVLTGCFVILGAKSLATGLMTFVTASEYGAPPPVPEAARPTVSPPPPTYDPNAGASVPVG